MQHLCHYCISASVPNDLIYEGITTSRIFTRILMIPAVPNDLIYEGITTLNTD